MLTPTERAIAKMYYRLVYQTHSMTLEQVPQRYRPWLDEYRREVEGD